MEDVGDGPFSVIYSGRIRITIIHHVETVKAFAALRFSNPLPSKSATATKGLKACYF
jgi:hypothetical protein